jgi:hypothetical protein
MESGKRWAPLTVTYLWPVSELDHRHGVTNRALLAKFSTARIKKRVHHMIEENSPDIGALRQQFLARRGSALPSLLGGYSTNAQKKRSGMGELASLVAKRRSDAIKISTISLQEKLVKGLDKVMSDQVRDFPEMEGRYFVGFIMGESPSVEVVDIEQAAHAVEGMRPDEARTALSENPVGYFSPGDFTVKTPADQAYQSFQAKLSDYLADNGKVIQYLQSHPEQTGSLDQFIKAPR